MATTTGAHSSSTEHVRRPQQQARTAAPPSAYDGHNRRAQQPLSAYDGHNNRRTQQNRVTERFGKEGKKKKKAYQ